MITLKDHQVTSVACGSGDAQTLCVTSGGLVWSWGDGDYGKLGRGGNEGGWSGVVGGWGLVVNVRMKVVR